MKLMMLCFLSIKHVANVAPFLFNDVSNFLDSCTPSSDRSSATVTVGGDASHCTKQAWPVGDLGSVYNIQTYSAHFFNESVGNVSFRLQYSTDNVQWDTWYYHGPDGVSTSHNIKINIFLF